MRSVAHRAQTWALRGRRVARIFNKGTDRGKFGVGAFSESLRQEVTGRHVRVSLVEPGAVATELSTHLRAEVREQAMQRFAGIERLEAEDIAEAIGYIVTRSRRVAVNELVDPPDRTRAVGRVEAPSACSDASTCLVG